MTPSRVAGSSRSASDLPGRSKPPSGVIAASTLVVEIYLVTAVLAGTISLATAFLLHLGVVTATVFRAIRDARQKVDAGPAVLLAVTTFVTGPLGALGCLVTGWLNVRGHESSDLLNAWYERISLSTETDAVTRLSDTVAIGRAHDPASTMPQSFAEIFHSGNITDQQRVLGLIARHFHPDYLPTLHMALANDAPVIRVQAAAVAAHVRSAVAVTAENAVTLVGDPQTTPDARLRNMRDIEACLASGLLDERDRARVDGQLAELTAQNFMTLEQDGAQGRLRDSVSIHMLERHFLDQGRFAEFRATRMRARHRLLGRYVTRRTRLMTNAVERQTRCLSNAHQSRSTR
jgi:hypothetical protein